MATWTLGSGGATGYNQNGLTVENERVIGTDPNGLSSIVWETRCDIVSGPDGGWNSSYYPVDVNYSYRFSVWVKRTSTSAAGTLYFGLNPTIIKLDNTSGNNPYWHCAGTSSLTKDVWFLVVGHCFYHSYAGTVRHADTGVYTTNGRYGDINGCNIGVDCKWSPGTTTAMHRTYHYYSTDGTTRLQFYDPRMDKCDGTETTIGDMLTMSASGNYDLIQNNVGTITGDVANVQVYPKHFSFPGVSSTASYINLSSTITLPTSSNWTISTWIRKDATYNIYEFWLGSTASNKNLVFRSNNSLSFRNVSSTYITLISDFSVYDGVWVNLTMVGSSDNYIRTYIDGIEKTYVNAVNNEVSITKIGDGYASTFQYPLKGDICTLAVYTTNLATSEILQNYNTLKGRFGK
jgi:hypothetical protein